MPHCLAFFCKWLVVLKGFKSRHPSQPSADCPTVLFIFMHPMSKTGNHRRFQVIKLVGECSRWPGWQKQTHHMVHPVAILELLIAKLSFPQQMSWQLNIFWHLINIGSQVRFKRFFLTLLCLHPLRKMLWCSQKLSLWLFLSKMRWSFQLAAGNTCQASVSLQKAGYAN